jgi:hypothetical protein
MLKVSGKGKNVESSFVRFSEKKKKWNNKWFKLQMKKSK